MASVKKKTKELEHKIEELEHKIEVLEHIQGAIGRDIENLHQQVNIWGKPFLKDRMSALELEVAALDKSINTGRGLLDDLDSSVVRACGSGSPKHHTFLVKVEGASMWHDITATSYEDAVEQYYKTLRIDKSIKIKVLPFDDVETFKLGPMRVS